ncbi:MAG: serine protease, partial [Kiritimatiellaceae bacterium]|nr:serine protease [Kiritimatiellaceae bacterium]
FADSLYRKHRESLYQIRVIENTSGEKATIGSAFCVSTNGLLASNYHVVSLVMRYPNRYRIECIGADGVSFPLQIADVDVVHDLAVLRSDRILPGYLTLNLLPLNKGETIFSLGNPLDLGMVIVDGTYNGLLEKSFYDKILFSGSLNGGMSGGPAIDVNGQVIGINVATRGEQISFLVPVNYLKELLLDIEDSGSDTSLSLNERVEQQLVENQNRYLERFMNAEWTLERFGKAMIPRIQDPAIHYWGDTTLDEEALFGYTYITSYSKDWIYLSPDLSVGKVLLNCEWYDREKLNVIRFYNLLEKEFSKTEAVNDAEKDDVTNFESHVDFVTIAGKDWRVAFSARNYKKYPRLYDVHVKMVTVSDADSALMMELSLAGVTKENGVAVLRKVMESVQW